MCTSRNPGTAFQADVWGWIRSGAPSPIHWLLLLFSAAGVVIIVLSFLHDIFNGPEPPPRSYFEAELWRGRRQIKVLGGILILMAFIGWGFALVYFTFLGDECSQSDPSLYNVALLLVLLLIICTFLVIFLGSCVCLDCCISGRVRLMLLISNAQLPMPSRTEQDVRGGDDASTFAASDERRVPGVPRRERHDSKVDADGGLCVGLVTDERMPPSFIDRGRRASWLASGSRPKEKDEFAAR